MNNTPTMGAAKPFEPALFFDSHLWGDNPTITPELAQSLFQKLNQLHFENRLPHCKIEISTRLTSTAGKIWPRQRLMRLSLAYHQHHGMSELICTILHEMIHLWLHEQGLPSGHTPRFREKLQEVGIADRVHALPMPTRPYKYLYRCPTCRREIRTRRQIQSSCGKCDKVYNPTHRFVLEKKF